jgi:hypothetical protein
MSASILSLVARQTLLLQGLEKSREFDMSMMGELQFFLGL